MVARLDANKLNHGQCCQLFNNSEKNQRKTHIRFYVI